MKKWILWLFLAVWVMFGAGCKGDGTGRLEYGFKFDNEWAFYVDHSEGGANFNLESTLVDNVVGGLFPGEVGPPAPEPDGP